MAINKASQGPVQAGNLFVGNGPSAGGQGPSPKRIKKIATFTATVTPTNPILASAVDVSTIAAVGVRAGDLITAVPPVNLEAGLGFAVFVSASDVITLRLVNPGVGTVATAAKSWTFIWTDLT